MIRLTKPDGTSYYVNPDQVVEVDTYNQKTTISTICTHGVFVTESPEEVVRKIMDYKMAMVRYGATQKNQNHDDGYVERMELERLAGLEDNQDG